MPRSLLVTRYPAEDLLPIVRERNYHPAQRGSYSIKAVLPTVAPELDYADIEEVQDGNAAKAAYLDAVSPSTSVPDAKNCVPDCWRIGAGTRKPCWCSRRLAEGSNSDA